MEIRNAIIERAILSNEVYGCLTSWLELDYGNSVVQSFGGFTLYVPIDNKFHKIESVAGHFIFRIMEIAGVNKWEELRGKPIRVKCTSLKVQAIGHFINDDWFDPEVDFSSLEEGGK